MCAGRCIVHVYVCYVILSLPLLVDVILSLPLLVDVILSLPLLVVCVNMLK